MDIYLNPRKHMYICFPYGIFQFYLLGTFDVPTNPIYVVTIEGTAPFIKIYQF